MNEVVTKEDLRLSQEHQTLQLTVRMGGLLALGVAILAALLKLT